MDSSPRTSTDDTRDARSRTQNSITGPSGDDDSPLLSVRNLRTTFHTDEDVVHAVDGVDFDIYPGETVGIVGESGAGKTVAARSMVGLVEAPGEVHPDSTVRFRGTKIGPDEPRDFESIRGDGVAMVFQDSLSALNPMYTIGNQIKESFRYQRGSTGQAATDRAIDLLEAVGIPNAQRRMNDYPHELSGGMRQRVLIAIALACDPDLLICDEPTTALDVTTQAQIIELLSRLQAEREMSMLFITHDMGLIAQLVDRVNVMYAGEIVERAPVEELFDDPKHPYTRGLLSSVPSARRSDDLRTIDGDIPTPTEPASHCRFAPRCPESFEACHRTNPQHVAIDRTDPDRSAAPERPAESSGNRGPDRTVACLLYPESVPREKRVRNHRGDSGPEENAGSNTEKN